MSKDFELPTTHPDYTDCWDRDTYDLQGGIYYGSKVIKVSIKNGTVIKLPSGVVIEHVVMRGLDIPPVIKCEHKWKSYMGLNEQFEYCELCDEKRELK